MSFKQETISSLWIGESASGSALSRGLTYLREVERLMLEPGMVDVLDNLRDRDLICSWIGENIHAVNARLNLCLQACHDCFHPQDRPYVQIFAVPLAQSFRLDGICNIQTRPITILIDVGRVQPSDWLALVAHEYAHAHLGNSGHDASFARVLAHLCLGLELEPPCWKTGMENQLRHFPPYVSVLDPLAFWRDGILLS
jgi:hypothetical protein